jgi:gluconate kinase
MLAKFRRGEPVDLPDDHPWLERVRQQCGVGKLMRRVRVVTHP